MRDIGLLQGGPPRPRAVTPPHSSPLSADQPEVRAHAAVVSSRDVPLATLSMAVPPPDAIRIADELERPAPEAHTARPTGAAQPRIPMVAGAPPPIRLRDLLWLGLALLVIVGTGVGI